MGYFDYLEEKVKEQKEFSLFDVWAKAGLYIFLASLLISIICIILFSTACIIGTNIYLDILVAVGIVVGVVGFAISLKAVIMAKHLRQKSELGSFCISWGLFFILVDVAMIVANTWVYMS